MKTAGVCQISNKAKKLLRTSHNVREISEAQFHKMVDSKDSSGYKPIGSFYLRSADKVIGIDNRSGDMWTEEFTNLESCLTWLSDYM